MAALGEHGPGPYVIVHRNLGVTEGEARKSLITDRLTTGTHVNVLHVVHHAHDRKIRGLIESPPGWITILDLDTARAGATPLSPGSAAQDGSASVSPLPPALVSAPPGDAAASTAALEATASSAIAGLVGAVTAGVAWSEELQKPERVRKLEEQARHEAASKAAVEAELKAVLSHNASLEARWAEASTASDDALRGAEEARFEASLLRRALADKDGKIVGAQEEREQLELERAQAEAKLQDLEAAFQERLQREISQKEQELLEEAASLRRTAELQEKRVQGLADENGVIQRRMESRGKAGKDAETNHATLLEAHAAIASAFGDLASEHPCLRLLDEPTLKLTAVFFKQPILRRAFFMSTTVMWIFALHGYGIDLLPQDPSIHV